MPEGALLRLLSFATPPETRQDEDCLYLNVWTPAARNDPLLPVILWVHGGSHRVGAGSHPAYRGDRLAARGCIVVTLNYRLGMFGYLAHPALTEEEGASGNYACLDIIAALRWIAANIRGFGGDPDCISLFGHSAGAALVSTIMASPLAQGLFHRAIGSSGGRFDGGMMGPPMRTLEQAEAAGVALASRLDCGDSASLRALPADACIAAADRWDVIIDGRVLQTSVQATFEAAAQSPVPLLVGYTSDEASAFPPSDIEDVEAWRWRAHELYGRHAETFLSLYPATADAMVARADLAARSDADFVYQILKWASLHARTADAPVHLYRFARPLILRDRARFAASEPVGGFGAFHGADILFGLGTAADFADQWEDVDAMIADRLGTALVRFAAAGDPGEIGSLAWPAYPSGAAEFHDRISAGPVLDEGAFRFFDSHHASARS